MKRRWYEVECAQCGYFAYFGYSKKEANEIRKNGITLNDKYFCSSECLDRFLRSQNGEGGRR
jgi:hypothetical protein